MKCQKCGRDSPDTEAFCRHCGRELVQTGERRCVSCGRPIGWDLLVCPYCGKDYRYQTFSQGPQGPLVSSGMRILLYLLSFFIPIVGFIIGAIYYTKPEDEYKQVGKMCIVLGIVSIVLSVGCSALLYVMVLGFGGTSSTPGINVLRKSSIAGGFKIEFTAPTSEVTWNDLTIQLSNGWQTISWTNISTGALTSATVPAQWNYGSAKSLGGLDVLISVTDIAANGRMSNGDYVSLTVEGGAFSSSTVYTLVLLYEPTDGSMLAYDFSG